MKKNSFGISSTVVVMAACLLIAATSQSFQSSQYGPLLQYDSMSEIPDSTPPVKKHSDKLSKEISDDISNEINAAISKAMIAMKSVDAAHINEEIRSSLKKIDAAKMKKEIDQAIRETDFAAIQKQVDEALQQVEWAKISGEVELSLEKAKKEMGSIHLELIDEQLEKAKLEIEKAQDQLKKTDIEKIVHNAQTNIEAAIEKLQLQKDLLKELETDGLINRHEGFHIEYKYKHLYINGKKQGDQVTQKYQHYFNGEDYELKIDQE